MDLNERNNNILEQIRQNEIEYDTKDYTIEEIVLKYSNYEKKINNYQEKMYICPICGNFVQFTEYFRAYVCNYCFYFNNYLWDEKQQSSFIESIIMKIPISYIYIIDNKSEFKIIDGEQRIQAISLFKQNILSLQNLQILTLLNGFKYSDLPIIERKRFDNRMLRVIVFENTPNDNIIHNIVEKINRKEK